MRGRTAISAAILWLALAGLAWPQLSQSPAALRSAVPILCTETNFSGRTRVRGTGVIADSGGTLLTAAHVIEQARSNCTLSIMVPDEEWSRFRQLRAFLIEDCRTEKALDLAVCRTRPAAGSRDWGYIRGANIRQRAARAGEAVRINAFAGWGLIPLVRNGHVTGRSVYQRADGCYCDFAIDISSEAGMSGSPVISQSGEVLGILTLSGSGKFRGISFGATFREAAAFLKAQGVMLADDFSAR